MPLLPYMRGPTVCQELDKAHLSSLQQHCQVSSAMPREAEDTPTYNTMSLMGRRGSPVGVLM